MYYKKIIGFSLIFMSLIHQSTAIGMGRSARTWRQLGKGVVSRLTAWATTGKGLFKGMQKVKPQTVRSGRLAGTFGATLAMAPLVLQPGTAQAENNHRFVRFSKESIDARPDLKQKFIQYAQLHITAQDQPTVDALVYLFQKYPDAARQVYPFILQNCQRISPRIQKVVGISAVTQPQRSSLINTADTIKKVQELMTPSNVIQYGILPAIDLENGGLSDNIVPSIASAITTDLMLHTAEQYIPTSVKKMVECPVFVQGSWNVGNRACRLGKFMVRQQLRSMVAAHVVNPVFGINETQAR